jgi:hypothetical protein
MVTRGLSRKLTVALATTGRIERTRLVRVALPVAVVVMDFPACLTTAVLTLSLTVHDLANLLMRSGNTVTLWMMDLPTPLVKVDVPVAVNPTFLNTLRPMDVLATAVTAMLTGLTASLAIDGVPVTTTLIVRTKLLTRDGVPVTLNVSDWRMRLARVGVPVTLCVMFLPTRLLVLTVELTVTVIACWMTAVSLLVLMVGVPVALKVRRAPTSLVKVGVPVTVAVIALK